MTIRIQVRFAVHVADIYMYTLKLFVYLLISSMF
jgi:hypothetical protein